VPERFELAIVVAGECPSRIDPTHYKGGVRKREQREFEGGLEKSRRIGGQKPRHKTWVEEQNLPSWPDGIASAHQESLRVDFVEYTKISGLHGSAQPLGSIRHSDPNRPSSLEKIGGLAWTAVGNRSFGLPSAMIDLAHRQSLSSQLSETSMRRPSFGDPA
jgi:hypothetical protein